MALSDLQVGGHWFQMITSIEHHVRVVNIFAMAVQTLVFSACRGGCRLGERDGADQGRASGRLAESDDVQRPGKLEENPSRSNRRACAGGGGGQRFEPIRVDTCPGATLQYVLFFGAEQKY